MKMIQPLMLCFSLLTVPIFHYQVGAVQNLKAIYKRLVNGSPMNDFDENWVFTATVDIFHYSNATWLRHPICLGTFLRRGEKHMVITAADCFFPPGYNHTQFSYRSKNNYRVFLGVVRIRYGTREYSNANRFGLRSTRLNPTVAIHPGWKLCNSTEDTNIAIILVSYKCIKRLNEAEIKGGSPMPQFLNLAESDELVSGPCAVAGWKTELPDEDVFSPDRVHKYVELTIGQFLSLNSSTCNQYFTNLNITKRLKYNQFCITGTYGDCVEVYLSQYEYGSGVSCSGKWSGFVSAIVASNTVVNYAPFLQFATVSTTAAIRRFVVAANLSDGSFGCILTGVTPALLGHGPKKNFNPISARDYASP